ncbi:hypothetical protein, partial [Dialister succinatiphilus]|uniref:hypothetical protein n=1 Tax=Dialister succinatiphilus TaxID=487173 RepID=UPI004028B0BC
MHKIILLYHAYALSGGKQATKKPHPGPDNLKRLSLFSFYRNGKEKARGKGADPRPGFRKVQKGSGGSEGSEGSEGCGLPLRAMSFIMPPSAVTSTSSIIIRITTVHPFATSWPSSPKGDARSVTRLAVCVICDTISSATYFLV